VNNHLVPLGESFVTELALIRSCVGVDALVLPQQVPALEALLAVSTLIRTLAYATDGGTDTIKNLRTNFN
jgi:hypothetical protein